jgi:hypothetical protein
VVLVEDDALDQRAGDDVHVVLVARDGGPQIGAGGAPALLALLRHLIEPDAFLHGAVEIVEALVAACPARRGMPWLIFSGSVWSATFSGPPVP